MNTQREFPVLIGIHKSDAYKIIVEFNKPYRLIEEDGRRFYTPSSEKLNVDRVNLYIKDGIVVDYKFF